MTQDQKIIRAKVGLLELAKQLGNVSQACDMLDGEVEQLARGRVDPMRVLEDHDYRLPACQTLELSDQRLQCPLLLALRTGLASEKWRVPDEL